MGADSKRTVVVTGASAGVGRAVALAFARHGWRVALIARSPAGLESAKRELEGTGAQASVFPADVADANAMFEAARKIVELWGGIDVWVNNAMVSVFAPIAATAPEEFRRVTEVTYLGYVHGALAALAHMQPRNAGTIVQVGSALSYRAIPLQAPYCAAKFAVRGFTDALRSELRHDRSGVRITMVQLPAVNTPQFDWSRNKMGFRAQPVPPIHPGNLFAPAAHRHATHGRFDDRAKGSVAEVDPAMLRGVAAFAGAAVALLLMWRLSSSRVSSQRDLRCAAD